MRASVAAPITVVAAGLRRNGMLCRDPVTTTVNGFATTGVSALDVVASRRVERGDGGVSQRATAGTRRTSSGTSQPTPRARRTCDVMADLPAGVPGRDPGQVRGTDSRCEQT